MADIDLKTSTPDTSLPTTGFLFGADSQAASAPSVYSTQTVATTLLGSTSLTGATITASAPVLDLSQTWNNGATTFTAIKMNVTDTASNAASLLMDLQVGGTSVAHFTKNGILRVGNASKSGVIHSPNDVSLRSGTGGDGYGVNILTVTSSNSVQIPFGNLSFGGDITLTRRAAANLRFGAADAAAPVAQTLSVQSVVAGTTNTTGANLTITGSQGTGTGAGGSIVFQVAPAGSSGTAQNALADALTITSNRRVTVAENIVGPLGNTGAVLGGLVLGFSGVSTGNIAGGQIQLFEAGTLRFRITDTALNMYNSAELSWSSATGAGGTADVRLFRDAANTLALRNGANAQTFNVYGTYTDASNYERLRVVSGSSYELICEAAGTGTARGLQLKAGSGNNLSFGGNGAAQWRVNFSGHLEAITDNVSDIGASGANRPRNVHVAGTVIPGRGVTVAGLPTPSTGMIARVTDALAPTIGATVTGGGAAYALVNYNGANWTVIGV